MFIYFYISFAVVKLFLVKKESPLFQLKYTMRNFIIIFSLSFLMLFEVFLDEYTLHYFLGCEHLQEDCERIGRESIEEYQAKGE